MTAIKTPSLARYIADQILESVSEPAATELYVAVGKPAAWANDANADTPVNTVDEINGIWNNMHFAKRITGNDLSLVTRRVNWTANTVYDEYTHDADLSTLDYYVLTSDYNVYKCLENNQGAASTVEPTYTGINTTNRTSDGYLWKFMFRVSKAARLRFLTDEWMPVKKLTMNDGSTQWGVQSSAANGAIEAIQVTAAGVGYSSDLSYTVTIGGDGSGAAANLVSNTVTNTINYIVVTTGGSGYTWANVTITPSSSSANSGNAKVIISPPGGHGSDPAYELGVTGIMLNVRLVGDENASLTVGNDFRQISLIRNPSVAASGNVSSNTVINQVMEITLSGSGGNFIDDEWVYQGGSLAASTFKGRVIYFASNLMQVTNTQGTIRSTTLTGATSAAQRFVADYVSPELNKYSGTILYIDNRTPIVRASDQTENIQIPITF